MPAREVHARLRLLKKTRGWRWEWLDKSGHPPWGP